MSETKPLNQNILEGFAAGHAMSIVISVNCSSCAKVFLFNNKKDKFLILKDIFKENNDSTFLPWSLLVKITRIFSSFYYFI